jgi:hypothetical protein
MVRWIAACDAWKQAGSYDQQVLAGILKAGETEDSREKAVQWALKVYNETWSSGVPGTPVSKSLAGRFRVGHSPGCSAEAGPDRSGRHDSSCVAGLIHH